MSVPRAPLSSTKAQGRQGLVKLGILKLHLSGPPREALTTQAPTSLPAQLFESVSLVCISSVHSSAQKVCSF